MNGRPEYKQTPPGYVQPNGASQRYPGNVPSANSARPYVPGAYGTRGGQPGNPYPFNVPLNPGSSQYAQPQARQPYPYPGQTTPGNRSGNGPGQLHLGDWLDRHQALSTQEKERALQTEPGFNRLAPEQQQRLQQRLHELDAMPAPERQRTLQRVENMERLSPEQREQVRGAADQLRSMPMERQRAVRRAFQDLRNVPPGLRNSELANPRFAGQFSPEERSVLGNLLSVEPYQPGPAPPR